MERRIYIRLHPRIKVKPDQSVYLQDIAQYILPSNEPGELLETPIYTISENDERVATIDSLQVIRFIKKMFPEMDVESLGENHTILEIMSSSKSPTFMRVGFVWLLLFFGSGLAIMHFHEDVNMAAVHQKMYFMLTGQEDEHPLILQIPYSLGIGLGMILFFNRVFKKKFNEEPSPLEVEMFNYQQNIDEYTVMDKQWEDKKQE
ncbi:stage V sporulation protein AA [Salicibibacter cibi]|uniref:Stage V sporulation protein AA n=1 Tax=Salicibibacter cibi TaxID=2743001 RepID=A0A7T7CGD7_9BACI|nr:stage V sporulation protein AA [Salicibibacter cibi]QQK80909.1 stage V sporulation protein AA [Salicibibacter cibi]